MVKMIRSDLKAVIALLISIYMLGLGWNMAVNTWVKINVEGNQIKRDVR